MNMNEDIKPYESAQPKKEAEIIVNEYGAVKDSAVAIEEETRTVLLTENETIVIEKPAKIDIVPKNRPRKVYGGMWGNAEIATVGLGMLAVLATIILFAFVVLPAQQELAETKKKRDNLETETISARNKYGKITTTEARVAELVNSASDFETKFLPIASNGKTALYQRINGLISAYGLVNTTGPDYAPLEIADETGGQASDAERGRAKFQSLFPGVYVTTTVEGSYQNLRRFIREIETSDQFVVISAVELQPSENEEKNKTNTVAQTQTNNVQITPNNPAGFPQAQTFEQTFTQPQQRVTRGKTHGETVSLRLEMAAYFRRSIIQPMITGNQ
ncbi:MAG: hypothetical protein M3Q33_08795 [Acidobacteriota bacterium]|nr:hypothetical protein [Acidobacteriota bacterium]